jgi:serine/threonine-protein kinase HipA
MLIKGVDRTSQVGVCIAAASVFLLSQQEAIDIVNYQVKVIEQKWQAICDEAALSEIDRGFFWQRQFLNPFAFLNAPSGVYVPFSGSGH